MADILGVDPVLSYPQGQIEMLHQEVSVVGHNPISYWQWLYGMLSHILLAAALWVAVLYVIGSMSKALHVQSTGRFVGHSPIRY